MKKVLYLLLMWHLPLLAYSGGDKALRYKQQVFENVQKDSLVYTIADGTPLMTDIYQPVGDTAKLRPLVILAHGGSFMHGNRKSDRLPATCIELAKCGYAAVSIDYRLTNLLGMSTRKAVYKNILKAVADGRNCIHWFLNNAAHGNTWRVDTTKVFFGGTSAGGILAEQLVFIVNAEKGNTMLRKAIKKYLPDSTAHAAKAIRGLISMAGAVVDTSIINGNCKAILHIHGDEDHIVPYGYKHALYGFAPVKMAGLGACRSIYTTKKIPFMEYVFKGKGHTSWDNNDSDFEIVKSMIIKFLAKEIK